MKGGHAGAGGEHGSGDMSLRFAGFDRNWKRTADAALDLRVCECCPTAVAVTSEGPIVAYRDRSADRGARHRRDAGWRRASGPSPGPIAEEGWVFPACPVNGPSLSARGRNVAAAWFQAKDGKPKSFAAFSSDAGRTFGAPIRLDQDGTLGRVDIELLPDGSAAAGYIDLTGEPRRIPRQTRAARRLRLGAGHDRESRQQPFERISAHGAARQRAGLRLDRSRRRVVRPHGRRLSFRAAPADARSLLALVAATAALARGAAATQPADRRVEIVATPNGGIQPQAVVDAAGTIHLLYFKGEPGGGDLFYVRRKAGDAEFSAPLRVNSEAGTAIATGSVRGGQIALGRNGWIHVGVERIAGARARRREADADVVRAAGAGRHARSSLSARSASRRNISTAAARSRPIANGQVHVVWHAAGLEDGEPNRRIYVATSADDGARFAPEKAFAIEGGACGCCGVETLVDAEGAPAGSLSRRRRHDSPRCDVDDDRRRKARRRRCGFSRGSCPPAR